MILSTELYFMRGSILGALTHKQLQQQHFISIPQVPLPVEFTFLLLTNLPGLNLTIIREYCRQSVAEVSLVYGWLRNEKF